MLRVPKPTRVASRVCVSAVDTEILRQVVASPRSNRFARKSTLEETGFETLGPTSERSTHPIHPLDSSTLLHAVEGENGVSAISPGRGPI
jgi:hypothetical protein